MLWLCLLVPSWPTQICEQKRVKSQRLKPTYILHSVFMKYAGLQLKILVLFKPNSTIPSFSSEVHGIKLGLHQWFSNSGACPAGGTVLFDVIDFDLL